MAAACFLYPHGKVRMLLSPRRFAAALLAALLLGAPAAALAAGAPVAGMRPIAIWSDAVTQVRAFVASLLPAPSRSGAVNHGRGMGPLTPQCSGNMDPDGRCLGAAHPIRPQCSGGMDPNGRCLGASRPIRPQCSGNMDPNGRCL